MPMYIDNFTVEQTATLNAQVLVPTSTVTASGTLALTSASTRNQVLTGSTAGQIVKLPSATTLVNGQLYDVYNAASVSVVIQDGGANPLLTLQPNQLVTFRLLSNGTTAGTWAWNAIDQSMAAQDQFYCTYPGTGLAVNYLAGIAYFNGTEYSIAAGSVTVGASIASGYIYVDPTTHAVTAAASLPNNALAMATFTSSATAVTALNDAREEIARNLVWGQTANIQPQNSQSTASGGSLELYARADHVHAMNIPLIKSGQVAQGSFSGNPKTAAVTFATAFASSSYNVVITGSDGRSWIATSVASTGFTISAQANQALTGPVFWHAIYTGEAV